MAQNISQEKTIEVFKLVVGSVTLVEPNAKDLVPFLEEMPDGMDCRLSKARMPKAEYEALPDLQED